MSRDEIESARRADLPRERRALAALARVVVGRRVAFRRPASDFSRSGFFLTDCPYVRFTTHEDPLAPRRAIGVAGASAHTHARRHVRFHAHFLHGRVRVRARSFRVRVRVRARASRVRARRARSRQTERIERIFDALERAIGGARAFARRARAYALGSRVDDDANESNASHRARCAASFAAWTPDSVDPSIAD